MKKLGGIIDILKIAVKYGAYVIVIVDIINYAIDKITAIQNEVEKDFKIEKKDAK